MEKQKTQPSSQLSEREIMVVGLLYQELSNKEISERLFISIHTVEKHRENIMKKTGAHTLAGLIKYAIENNIVANKQTEVIIRIKTLIIERIKDSQENSYKRTT